MASYSWSSSDGSFGRDVEVFGDDGSVFSLALSLSETEGSLGRSLGQKGAKILEAGEGISLALTLLM